MKTIDNINAFIYIDIYRLIHKFVEENEYTY